MSDALYLKRLRAGVELVTLDITRPSNTTAYANGDIIGDNGSPSTILTLANMGAYEGGGGIILSATLVSSNAPTLPLDAVLRIFDTAVTTSADNAAWAVTDAEAKREVVQPIMFSGGNSFGVSGATNRVTPGYPGNAAYKCLAGTKDMKAVLVALNAYVPASAEELRINLLIQPFR
jgi:hypothetical protein